MQISFRLIRGVTKIRPALFRVNICVNTRSGKVLKNIQKKKRKVPPHAGAAGCLIIILITPAIIYVLTSNAADAGFRREAMKMEKQKKGDRMPAKARGKEGGKRSRRCRTSINRLIH